MPHLGTPHLPQHPSDTGGEGRDKEAVCGGVRLSTEIEEQERWVGELLPGVGWKVENR